MSSPTDYGAEFEWIPLPLGSPTYAYALTTLQRAVRCLVHLRACVLGIVGMSDGTSIRLGGAFPPPTTIRYGTQTGPELSRFYFPYPQALLTQRTSTVVASGAQWGTAIMLPETRLALLV